MNTTVKVCATAYYPQIMKSSEDSFISYAKKYWDKALNDVFYEQPDLIVLPECCDRPTGLSTSDISKFNIHKGNDFLNHIKNRAKQEGCFILCSTVEKNEDDICHNTSHLFNRQGESIAIYNKAFPTSNEMNRYNIIPGRGALTVDCELGRIGFAICWDLNFRELIEEYIPLKPDFMLFSSMFHGGFKAQMWAYELGAYFIGAIGGAGKRGYILNPVGELINQTTEYKNTAISDINLNYATVQNSENLSKFKVIKAKYKDSIEIHIPPSTGAVMISSSEFDVKKIVKEFDLKSFERTLDETREYRNKIL